MAYLSTDKSFFYRQYLSLALPMVMQGFIQSSLNMVDAIMIGRLGETQIAAVGLANQVVFIFIVMIFGINNGCSIFIAQFWGVKDTVKIKEIISIGLKVSICLSTIFFVISFVAPNIIMNIFSNDPDVILVGSRYLKILSFSFIFTAISYTYSTALKSTESVSIAIKISILIISINTIINYFLIYGKFNFPRLGVDGAAIATLVARAIEVLLITIIVFKNKKGIFIGVKEIFCFSGELFKQYIKISGPIVFSSMLWVLGLSIYKIVYARMGTNSIVSINIVNALEALATVFFLNMANAGAILIGKNIGASNYQTAKSYSKNLLALGLIIGAVTGLIMILCAERFLSMYRVTDAVHDSSIKIIQILGTVLSVKAFNSMMILGIFRSGGDTKYGLIIDFVGLYVIGIPIALLGGFVWDLQIQWVYLLVFFEEVFKIVLAIPRYISGKWIYNIVTNTKVFVDKKSKNSCQ